jgi:hypothetical protein
MGALGQCSTGVPTGPVQQISVILTAEWNATLAGADFQYRDSNFRPGKILLSDFYYVRSMSDTKGDDDSFGAALNLPNEPWGLETRFKQLGTNYSPALGFVNRTGIRQFDGTAQYRRRDLGWHWFDVATSWYAVTDLSNHLESRENGIWTGISLRSTDEFYLRAFNDYEDVPVQFKIAGKVPVPAGRYNWTNGSIYIQTSNARPITARLDVLCCSYYDGHQLRTTLQLDMRPNATFQFAPKYTYTYLDLPGGLLNIHAVSLSLITNFTPDMQLYTEVQYDNVSEKFALSVRYQWEYEPGQEFFFDLQARELGTSKLTGLLTVVDEKGKKLASAGDGPLPVARPTGAPD